MPFPLEQGIAVGQGQRLLRTELPRILATPPDVRSPRMVQVIRDLAEDWRRHNTDLKAGQVIFEVIKDTKMTSECLIGVDRCNGESLRILTSLIPFPHGYISGLDVLRETGSIE